jgi:hypothetical protein
MDIEASEGQEPQQESEILKRELEAKFTDVKVGDPKLFALNDYLREDFARKSLSQLQQEADEGPMTESQRSKLRVAEQRYVALEMEMDRKRAEVPGYDQVLGDVYGFVDDFVNARTDESGISVDLSNIEANADSTEMKRLEVEALNILGSIRTTILDK